MRIKDICLKMGNTVPYMMCEKVSEDTLEKGMIYHIGDFCNIYAYRRCVLKIEEEVIELEGRREYCLPLICLRYTIRIEGYHRKIYYKIKEEYECLSVLIKNLRFSCPHLKSMDRGILLCNDSEKKRISFEVSPADKSLVVSDLQEIKYNVSTNTISKIVYAVEEQLNIIFLLLKHSYFAI